MDQDRNLLFAVFAAQLMRVPAPVIVEVATAWLSARTRPIAELFVEREVLSTRDRNLLLQLVENAVQAHGGDAQATLATFGGAATVAETFHGGIVMTDSGDLAPGEAAAEAMADVPGVDEAAGRYTGQTEHARGGMGRVLFVHDEYLGRDIALKELLPGLGTVTGSGPDKSSFPFIARFLQEARITGQLEHPSIVPVYELGHRLDGSLYYTMKLVRGRTLAKAISDAGSLEGRLKLLPHFVDLCNAIAYAHARGVIHRDIKPGNIMVGEFGETVVLDWGIAKILGKEDLHAQEVGPQPSPTPSDAQAPAATEYGQALGTLVYMPPEQALGHLERIDHRSDIYSLGAVLYELLTGTTPFDLTEMHPLLWRSLLLKKVIEDAPRPIRKLAPGVPPELAAVAARALQKDPEQRYQSAQELASEIQRFQTGALVSAYSYNFTDYLRRYARRHRSQVITAAVALVLVLGLSVAYSIRLRHSQQLAAEARRREEDTLYRSVMVVVPQYLKSEHSALARKTLWAAPERCRGWEWGHLLRMMDDNLLSLEGATILDVDALPRGEAFVLAQAPMPDPLLYVWNMNAGRLHATLTGQGIAAAGALFMAGQSAATVMSPDGGLRLWDLPGGTLRASAKPSSPIAALQYVGDGNLLAAYDNVEDAPTAYLDARTGRATQTPLRALPPEHYDRATGHVIEIDDERNARVIDASGSELFEIEASEPLKSVAFGPDGTRIITLGDSGAVKLWDGAGLYLNALENMTKEEGYVRLSTDNTRALGCNYVSIRVWDTASGATIFDTVRERRCRFLGEFVPGRHAVIGIEDAAVRVWDVEPQAEPAILRCATGEVPTVDAQCLRVAITGQDNVVQLLDAATQRRLVRLEGHQDHIYITQFSESGGRVLTASWDNTLRVWDATSGRTIATLSPHGRIRKAGFSGDESRVWMFADDGAFSVWDIAGTKMVAELRAPGAGTLIAASSADLAKVVLVQEDQTVTVWDTIAGRMTLEFKSGFEDRVRHAALTPGATHLLLASTKSNEVWDLRTGKLLRELDVTSRVNPVPSPDGVHFVGKSMEAPRNGAIYSLENATPGPGDAVSQMEGHEAPLRCLAFNADGTRIVSGSNDRTARVWDAASGETLAVLEGHEGPVISTSFSADGMRVMTLTDTNVLRIWHASPYREEHLPTLSGAAKRMYPGSDVTPWKNRYHLWKQAGFEAWLAAN